MLYLFNFFRMVTVFPSKVVARIGSTERSADTLIGRVMEVAAGPDF